MCCLLVMVMVMVSGASAMYTKESGLFYSDSYFMSVSNLTNCLSETKKLKNGARTFTPICAYPRNQTKIK